MSISIKMRHVHFHRLHKSAENSGKNPKFKIGNHMRISKWKYFWKRLHIKLISKSSCKVKNTVPWTYFISDLNGEKIVGTF